MSTPENRATLAHQRDEMTAEHAAVGRLVERLLAPLLTPAAAFPLLDELHATLRAHFAREELPGGFYETMGACTPEHAEELRVLVDQHYLIACAVHSLRERARGAAPDAAFARDLGVLCTMLARHERIEHKLTADLADREGARGPAPSPGAPTSAPASPPHGTGESE
jgi:hypothetical protein